MAAGTDKASPKPRSQRASTAPQRAFGRSLSDFTAHRHSDGKPLWPAERALLEACRKGEMAWIAGTRPDKKTEENTIRAGFLRFLILGGDMAAPVHEKGVQVNGAWIDGGLDLEGCSSDRAMLCWVCRFSHPVILRDARLAMVSLAGSEVPGIEGDRVTVSGGIFLRNGFRATGEVRLPGAQISGTLTCSGGTFDAKGYALACDRMIVTGSVYFTEDFRAAGQVRLPGAQIGGTLACSGGIFDAKDDALSCDRVTVAGSVNFREGFRATGTVRLHGARIGGTLDCSGGTFAAKGDALSCDRSIVKGAFILREKAHIAGTLDLAKASIGAVADDATCWPEPGNLILDGCTYDSFDGGAPSLAAKRADWLLRQQAAMLGPEFCPQPWTQAIKVLSAMGHARDARDLAIRFEEQRRKAGIYGGIMRPLHWLFGALAGYGYRPLRLLGWMAVCWLFCAILYENAGERGVMAPANPLVFDAPAYQATCRPRAGSAAHWLHGGCKGPNEYSAFSPWIYSLDLILPLVELQQDRDWAPMVTRDAPAGSASATEVLPLGVFTRAVMWFEILLGWVASLLFVAILTGLVRKSGEE